MKFRKKITSLILFSPEAISKLETHLVSAAKLVIYPLQKYGAVTL